MRHSVTRDLFRYWNDVRATRASPERDEIDPTAIRQVLADTFLIETRPDGTFPLRLTGTRIDALWMSDQKDRCFLDFWGEDRHSVAAALWTVMDGAVPVLLGAKAKSRGRPEVVAEALVLPLRHRGKTHSLLLAALSLAETPSWIGLLPIERLRLVSLRVLTSAEVVTLPVLRQNSRAVHPDLVEQRAHLTVYSGGRTP